MNNNKEFMPASIIIQDAHAPLPLKRIAQQIQSGLLPESARYSEAYDQPILALDSYASVRSRDRSSPLVRELQNDVIHAYNKIVQTAGVLAIPWQEDGATPRKRPRNKPLSFDLPQFAPSDDEMSYRFKIFNSLALLDSDPKSIEVSSQWFRYSDRWERGELILEIALLPDVLNSLRKGINLARVEAAVSEARTHLAAIREIVHSDSNGDRVQDVFNAKSELCLNLLELKE